MSAEAIRNVALALENRLKAALSAANSNGSTYVGPLDDRQAANASLILFLYRVQPNLSLRNTEHRLGPATSGGSERSFANALPLDLHFLLTVGPRTEAGEPESLRLLGYAMQALNDNALLPPSQVAGEAVRITLDSVSVDEMGRVWSLFPTVNYRTSVLYLATPVWIDPAAMAQAAAATLGATTSTGSGDNLGGSNGGGGGGGGAA